MLYPLLLFYVFSLLTCVTRLGRYIAMLVALIQGRTIYSLLSLLTNSFVGFFKVIVGFTQFITMQELTVGLQICLVEASNGSSSQVAHQKRQDSRKYLARLKKLSIAGTVLLMLGALAELGYIYAEVHKEITDPVPLTELLQLTSSYYTTY